MNIIINWWSEGNPHKAPTIVVELLTGCTSIKCDGQTWTFKTKHNTVRWRFNVVSIEHIDNNVPVPIPIDTGTHGVV